MQIKIEYNKHPIFKNNKKSDKIFNVTDGVEILRVFLFFINY